LASSSSIHPTTAYPTISAPQTMGLASASGEPKTAYPTITAQTTGLASAAKDKKQHIQQQLLR